MTGSTQGACVYANTQLAWYADGMAAVVWFHYSNVIMGTIASQITSFTIVYSTVYTDADQRKHQRSASLTFVRVIHRGPVNSPQKWPITRKMFPFDDVIILWTGSCEQFLYFLYRISWILYVWFIGQYFPLSLRRCSVSPMFRGTSEVKWFWNTRVNEQRQRSRQRQWNHSTWNITTTTDNTTKCELCAYFWEAL